MLSVPKRGWSQRCALLGLDIQGAAANLHVLKRASKAKLSWLLCAPHPGGEAWWCPRAPVPTGAGDTQIHLPCLGAHWLSEEDWHTKGTVPVAVMAVVWLLRVLRGTQGKWKSQAPRAGCSAPSTICVHFSGCEATYNFILRSKHVTELLPHH